MPNDDPISDLPGVPAIAGAPADLPGVPAMAGAPAALCLDIGGSGIKGLTVDPEGRPLGERVRLATPAPATPAAVMAVVAEIAARVPAFGRVSAGFPGVVVEGVVRTAPNLDPSWAGYALAAALAERTGRPARVANDAGVQGLAVIEGRGTELVITLAPARRPTRTSSGMPR